MSIEDLKGKLVCAKCIGDAVVKGRIADEGENGQCSYCEEEDTPCLPVDEIATMVNAVYRKYFSLGEEYAYFQPESDKPSFDHEGDPPSVIVKDEILEVENEEIAEDVVAINSDNEGHAVYREGDPPAFDESLNYAPRPIYDSHHSDSWQKFCEAVKHKSRFFNTDAKALLSDILQDLEKLSTSDGRSPIRIVGGDAGKQAIFRGRRADTASDVNRICLFPATEFGPPPTTRTPAGRMNPAGIPVLYASLDRKTCLAELRVPIGGRAVTAEFDILRPIRVLDLTALRRAFRSLSRFSNDYERLASHLRFLREFDDEISKPVLPSDELLEYIPTQAFIEFLGAAHTPPFDAVIYSSTQTGAEGKNIVVLPRAVVIERPTKIFQGRPFSWAMMDDDTYMLYEGADSDAEKDRFQTFEETSSEFFGEDAAVRFVEDSLQIHTITAIEHVFETADVEIMEKGKGDSHSDF